MLHSYPSPSQTSYLYLYSCTLVTMIPIQSSTSTPSCSSLCLHSSSLPHTHLTYCNYPPLLIILKVYYFGIPPQPSSTLTYPLSLQAAHPAPCMCHWYQQNVCHPYGHFCGFISYKFVCLF